MNQINKKDTSIPAGASPFSSSPRITNSETTVVLDPAVTNPVPQESLLTHSPAILEKYKQNHQKATEDTEGSEMKSPGATGRGGRTSLERHREGAAVGSTEGRE